MNFPLCHWKIYIATGDKYLKPYVTADPETGILRRDPMDEFLIIATDGLWDVLSNELACEIVSRCLQEGSPPPTVDPNSGSHSEDEAGHTLYPSRSALAAALLTRLALARKSLDNISVVVVDLKRSWPEQKEQAPGLKIKRGGKKLVTFSAFCVVG